MDLSGKNVIYIGGFGGIGLSTCKALIEKKIANLIILDLSTNEPELRNLSEQDQNVNVHFWRCDLIANINNIRNTLREILGKIPDIHLLVNGAGIVNENEWERTVQVNLIGVIKATKVAMELFDKRKRGGGLVICTIASVTGLDHVAPLAVYSATKAGLISFTKSVADFHAITGITAYLICPGITRTAMMENRTTFMDLGKDDMSRMLDIAIQEPEECAKNIITAMETNKNGAIWVLDMGKIELVELHNYDLLPKPSPEI